MCVNTESNFLLAAHMCLAYEDVMCELYGINVGFRLTKKTNTYVKNKWRTTNSTYLLSMHYLTIKIPNVYQSYIHSIVAEGEFYRDGIDEILKFFKYSYDLCQRL